MICRNQFSVYSTRSKKKKPQEMCVMLHPSMVVVAKKRKEKGRGKKKEHYLEFIEALDVSIDCVTIMVAQGGTGCKYGVVSLSWRCAREDSDFITKPVFG